MKKKIILCLLAIVLLNISIPSNAAALDTETAQEAAKTDTAAGAKISNDPLTRASTATDTGTTYISSALINVSSYGVSTSTIVNNKISTSNYLVIKGVQVNSYSSSGINVKTNRTNSISGSAGLTNRKEAYSHSTHTFECIGYKTHVLNTSVTL